jgi:type VI protein secretion system component Hcp
MRNKLVSIFVSIVLVLSFAIAVASGQPWAVMKVGTIQGDSTLAGYEGWCDILSYNISVQNAGWNIQGDPLPASLSDMYITKSIDRASPLLFGAVLTGQRFNDERLVDAQVHLLKVGLGGQLEPAVKWLFEDVVVSAYNTAYEGGQALELVALDYGEITYEYFPTADGVPGPPISFTYDRSVGEIAWLGSDFSNFQLVTQFQAEGVPEPAALVLAGIGLAALAGRRCAQRRARGAGLLFTK